MNTGEAYGMVEQARMKNDKRVMNFFLSYGLGKKERCIGYIQDIAGCDDETAEKVYDIYAKRIEEKKANEAQKEIYIPKCPTCGSPDIKKISGGKRWVSTGLFGIGSSDMGKTLECNNCGYKW